MHRNIHPVPLLITGILLFGLIGMACSTSPSPAVSQKDNPQDNDSLPAGNDSPPAAPTSSSEPGATRRNPVPISQLMSTPGWSFTVNWQSQRQPRN